MSHKFRLDTRRLLALALAVAVLAGTSAIASVAFAAQQQQPTLSELFTQLENTPVNEAMCTTLCHGNIANTPNYASEIKFSHGNHLLMQCSDCHPRFPHQQSGTQRPTMKTCYNCHGLRHGPRGIIAAGECEACHNTPRTEVPCPFAARVPDWSGAGHATTATVEAVNSDCMMCHKAVECTNCHDAKGVQWEPKNGWGYDAGANISARSGCYACHGNSTLLKTTGEGTHSFQVTGVDQSVHRTLTCQQCHVDYRYDDKPSTTNLWYINVGLQCETCHATLPKEQDRAPVALYEQSIHAQKIREGDYKSATCSSCHGGHFIYSLDTAAGKAEMHSSSYRVCARCHGGRYATYDDYYHGKAYKAGAPDAPACWQCHGAHKVLPTADPHSSVNPANVGKTCGQPGCHKGSTEEFGTEAAALIHTKSTQVSSNPILNWINQVKARIGM
jgi:hypothetical protein